MRIRASFQPPMKKTKEEKWSRCSIPFLALGGATVASHLWFSLMVFPLLLPGAVAERFRFPVQEFVVRMTSL